MRSEIQINAIVGPTGSGKSAIADSLAFTTGAPVVVADRIQCFTDIPVTTARTTSTNGISRYHLSDRTVSGGDYPVEEAFFDLMCRINELSDTHRLIILEGGSISLLSRFVNESELPFRLAVHVIPIKDRGQHWQRLRSRAMKLICPDDGRPGTVQELAYAWKHEQQHSFVATINGFEAILAWCHRNATNPSELAQQPLSVQSQADLAAEIANAHMAHSLEQEMKMCDLFESASYSRFTPFSTDSTGQSASTEEATQRIDDLSDDQDRNPRVVVFCGSRAGNLATYTKATEQLGQSLAAAGIEVVYGGGDIGLMGVLANTTLASGGTICGVLPRPMVDYELAHSGLTTMHVTETMHERKALMAQLGDAFIALPGGIGTAEEMMEILTWSQLGIHSKPCVLLNIDAFFDPLLQLLDHFITTGFMSAIDAQKLVVISDPISAVCFFQQTFANHRPLMNNFDADIQQNVVHE
jgi:uncharacterized protein (TIGR00730 family)